MLSRRLRPFVCLCLSALAAFCFALPSLGDERETVRVAVPELGVFFSMDESGAVSGYAYDYLMEIRKYTGWEYEFIPMSYNEALTALSRWEIDILPGNQYSAERGTLFDYSALDMGYGGTVLVVKNGVDEGEYSYNDFANYGGIRIAALKGSIRVEQTAAKLAEYGAEAVFTLYDTTDEMKAALERDDADALLTNITQCNGSYSILARINLAKIYFCSNKQRPELKESIDYAMEQIHLDNPYYEAGLYDKFYGDVKELAVLSDEEKEYILSAGPVAVALSYDMPPTEYWDSEAGEYRGFSADVLELVSEYTGLEFSYVARGDYASLSEGLESGGIQLVASVVNDDKILNGLPVSLTAPYYDSALAIVAYNESVFADNDGEMALKEGYPLFERVAKERGYTNISYYKTFDGCLLAVRNGTADYTLLPDNTASVFLSHSYYADLRSFALADSGYDFSVAVSDYADPRLISIINKALAAISEKEMTALLTRSFVETGGGRVTARDFIAKNSSLVFHSLFALLVIIAIVITVNSSRVRKLNKRLGEEVMRADESSAAKSEFLSRMSHDMRTPLNAVLGFTELARDEKGISENTADYLKKIHSSGKYLLGLINDVLDMAKIESGRIELNEECVNAIGFIDEMANVFRAEAAEKGIQLTTDFHCGGGSWLMLDPLRTRQIYANLLSNAIKFSAPGTEIVWTVKGVPCSPGTVETEATVEDHGSGMSPEFMERMFEPFEQSDPEHAATGTGLGLPIVKSLVSLMGGTISVQSEIGLGTKFTLGFKRKLCSPPDATPEERAPSPDALSGRRILICEDNALNATIARRLLENKGCTVEIAANGREGLEAFTGSETGHYDAILMDIRMPELDGLETTLAIRALPREDARRIPIIAMSANAFEEDRQKSFAAGMNEHLAKPIEPDKLFFAIARLCEKL